MNYLDSIYQAAGTAPGAYVKNYFARLSELLDSIEPAAVERMIEVLETAAAAGRTVFLIANGGSSGVASHMVNDMVVGGMMPGRPPLRALALTDNAASITAIGNDAGYEHVFSYQIEMLAGPGDVVIAMSVSGNSENIIRGVEAARRLGCATIGWAGMDGGRLAEACDVCVRVPATKDEYGPVEDAFSILSHAAVTWMIQRRGKKLHH